MLQNSVLVLKAHILVLIDGNELSYRQDSLLNFLFSVNLHWNLNSRFCPCQVLDRGERIELLVDKTEHLQQESMTFRREARRLKNKMWWQDKRLLVMIGAALLVILYIIIAVTCSPTFHC